MFDFLKPKDGSVNVRKVAADFATTGQITPDQVKSLAEAGYKTIICARPDNEEPGQPSFAAVSDAAKAAGLQTAYIPVSGQIGQGQVIRFRDAWEKMPKPMLGYCRSGARAGSLYQTLSR